jgi:hypothetical protein
VYPSIKTLSHAFPYLSDEQVKAIRHAMTYQSPRKAMERIDEILGTHGVEYISRGHNAKSPAITYCNMGDTYDTTILYVRDRYRVGCWGDIVERGHYD